MKRLYSVIMMVLFGLVAQAETLELTSPDGTIVIDFLVDTNGVRWSLTRKGQMIVNPSRIGLEFKGFKSFQGKEVPLGTMHILERRSRSADSTWETHLYRRGSVRDHFNELEVTLEEIDMPHRRLGYVFRAYDEGVAFRYIVPEQNGVAGFEILREQTEWRFPGKCSGWFTLYNDDHNSNEGAFERHDVSDIRPDALIGAPAIVEVAGQQVALCEAALVNWAGVYYKTPTGGQPDGQSTLEAHLTPLPKSEASTSGSAVIRETPAESPWRVMICADTQLDLLKNNDMILNLNPPPEKDLDFSWVKPGVSSWDWWVESNNSLSTELSIRLVDFAAEMGWAYHTIDGGWYGFARRPNHGPNVRLEPRRGFDLARIVEHARAKGVGIWLWIHWELINDTGIEETFARLEKWGVKGVKIDFMNRQDQWMVCWYERVCRAAAKHGVMVNFHGAHKPTGTERTWPNCLTREGIRGNEMNIFSKEITPTHCATLPFTRFLLGPGDFTPGGFGNVFSKDFVPQVDKGHRYGDETDRCPHWAEEMGTRAHALALCIAFDSPLMTLCDWPERYRGSRGVEALRRLPTTWASTKPIDGECGEHYSVLRETHDGRFYFAAFTVRSRQAELQLDFLDDSKWEMESFTDDPELTPTNPKHVNVASRIVVKGERVLFELQDEGGAVAIFRHVVK